MVSIQGSCLKLLQVAYAFCLPSLSLPILVRLFSRGGLGLYLYLYLFHYACIFNSLKIYAKIMACIGLHIQFPEDMCTSFVFFFFQLVWDLCLHIQFLEDMCTSSVFFSSSWYRICACISIPRRYVHKWPQCSDLQGSPQ